MVSVIIGVFNAEKTVKKAIVSILEQTYHDFEIIIIDDGSIDRTNDVIREMANLDQRIIVIQTEKNNGAASARNKGLVVASGEYIAIMDADDISHPERLSRQVDYLKRHRDCDFIGTKARAFNSEPGNSGDSYWFCQRPKKEDFLMTLPFVHASMMFRSDVLKCAGGYRANVKYKRSEDYEMLMRLYKQGYKGENLDETLYFIRTDESTYKRRKYRYRFNEFSTKLEGFSALGLMPGGLVFALKPLIVGLIPMRLLKRIKESYYLKKK